MKFKGIFKTKQTYSPNEPIDIEFTLQNLSGSPQRILKWYTPLDGFTGNFLTVCHNGQPVKYDGAFFKRGNPLPEDFLTLEPDKSCFAALDLSEAYNTRNAGVYTVELKENLIEVWGPADSLNNGSDVMPTCDFIECVQAQFTVGGGKPAKNSEERLTKGEQQRLKEKLNNKDNAEPNATAPYIAPVIKNATVDEENYTREAHAAMMAYLSGCIIDISRGSQNEHYKMIFGAPDRTRYTKVNGIIKTIKDGLVINTNSIGYEFNNDPALSKVYAYTFKGASTVFLCAKFKTAPLTGENSKIGTLFHEWSHAFGYTDDHRYGRSKCRNLAQNDPDKAVENADNYEYYLETEYTFWAGNEKISKRHSISPQCNYNPSLAVYLGKLYIIYKGAHSNTLYWSVFDGADWKKNEVIKSERGSTFETKFNPGAVVYNGLLYIFFESNNNICYAYFDGKNWGGQTTRTLIDPYKIQRSPNITVYNNRIYCVYKSTNSNDYYYFYYDENYFSTPRKVTVTSGNLHSDCNPGLAVHDNMLHIVYKEANSYMLRYASFNGTDWNENKKISDVSKISPKSDYSPRISAINDIVYIPYKDPDTNDMYHSYMYFDPVINKLMFTGNEKVSDNSDISPKTSCEHSVIEYNNNIYMVYKNDNSNDLYYAWQ